MFRKQTNKQTSKEEIKQTYILMGLEKKKRGKRVAETVVHRACKRAYACMIVFLRGQTNEKGRGICFAKVKRKLSIVVEYRKEKNWY